MQFTIKIPNPKEIVKRKIEEKIVGDYYIDSNNSKWTLSSFPNNRDNNYFMSPALALTLVANLDNLGYVFLTPDYNKPEEIEKLLKVEQSELERLCGKYSKDKKLLSEGELHKFGLLAFDFLADLGGVMAKRSLNGNDNQIIENWINAEAHNAYALLRKIAIQKGIVKYLQAYLDNIIR